MASFVASRLFDKVYPVSREFGVYDPESYGNYPGKKHPGKDFAAPAGVKTYAVMPGIISNVYARGNQTTGRGNEVVVSDGHRQVKYCHLNEIRVEAGQQVKVGDLIGLVGWTGYVLPKSEKGAHLHIELLIDGQYVDIDKHLTEGEDPVTDENFVRAFFIDLFNVDPSPEQIKQYVGRPFPEVYDELRNSQPRLDRLKYVQQVVKDNDARVLMIQELEAKIAGGGTGADVEDARKYRQLKELLK